MTKRKAQGKPVNRVKIGKTPLDPSRPIGKSNPPIETQFQAGNTMSIGVNKHPKTLTELKALIQAIGGESTSDKNLTRLMLLIRGQYAARNSADRRTVLEYGWGKVPLDINLSNLTDEQLNDYIASKLGLSDDQANAEAGSGATGGGAGDGGKAEAAVADPAPVADGGQ